MIDKIALSEPLPSKFWCNNVYNLEKHLIRFLENQLVFHYYLFFQKCPWWHGYGYGVSKENILFVPHTFARNKNDVKVFAGVIGKLMDRVNVLRVDVGNVVIIYNW